MNNIYIYIYVRISLSLYIYIPRGPSVLILRTGSYFSSVNLQNVFLLFFAIGNNY